MSNEVVLNWEDYVIRASDIEILNSKAWLNDALIGFYFQYLSKKATKCAFVGPEVTQLLKLISPDEIPVVLNTVIEELASKDCVMFAVNNCSNPDAALGGSHWSLLLYLKENNTFLHLDSSGDFNEDEASRISLKLRPFTNNATFRNAGCHQQANNYDCGCHVLRSAERLMNEVEISSSIYSTTFVLSAVPDEAAEMRKRLANLIQSLAKES